MPANNDLLQDAVNKIIYSQNRDTEVKIPVGVSQRHIHLTAEHVEVLFGKGYKLTPLKILMGEEFAAKECVTIVGPSLKSITDVRVLGPERKVTQVEISRTDTFVLKVSPPVRISGDVKDSEKIVVVGPKGVLYLAEGCIIAKRHIHMTVEDAQKYGLSDGQRVDVEVNSERPALLRDVWIRVAPKEKVRTEMHIDTDEANSVGLKNGDTIKAWRLL